MIITICGCCCCYFELYKPMVSIAFFYFVVLYMEEFEMPWAYFSFFIYLCVCVCVFMVCLSVQFVLYLAQFSFEVNMTFCKITVDVKCMPKTQEQTKLTYFILVIILISDSGSLTTFSIKIVTIITKFF